MKTLTVTSKGCVTLPANLRRKLGLHQGSKLECALVGERIELRASQPAQDPPTSGYGLLKSLRAPVPVDYDPAASPL